MTGDEDSTTERPGAHSEIKIWFREMFQQFGENVAAQTRALETLTTKVDDVRERVIRLEAARFEKMIEKLDGRITELGARISALEVTRERVTGAASFLGWLGRNTPWLAAAIIAGLTILGFQRH